MQIERAGYETSMSRERPYPLAVGCRISVSLRSAEMAAEAGRIARAVSIPTIVDADTGYGGPSAQVAEAVRIFEEADLAGMQIEDQDMAKKCGHLSGKSLCLSKKWQPKSRRPSMPKEIGIS